MSELAIWILSMSFMTDDMRRPVEVDSKKAAPWRKEFIEDFVAEIFDGGEADEVGEVIAEIIAEAADEEHGEDSDGDHREDVVDGGGKEVFEVDRVVDDRNREDGDGLGVRGGAEDAAHHGLDENGAGGGHGAHDRHEDDAGDEENPVAAGVAEEAEGVLH